MYTMAKKSVSQPRLAKILECLEKCLYHGSGSLPRVALFGVGADMTHLELQKRCSTVDECLEKCLYHGSGSLPRVALFGVGADMTHLELQKRCSTVDVIYSKLDSMDDKEFLSELENSTSGSIFAIHKFTSTDKESVNKGNGVRVMFLTPCAARKAL